MADKGPDAIPLEINEAWPEYSYTYQLVVTVLAKLLRAYSVQPAH